MKKTIFLFTLLVPAFLIAQVTEQQVSMSQGLHNAFVIELGGADVKMAENVWKKYVGEFGKTKKNRKSKEWTSEAIIIPAIHSDHNIQLFGKFEDFRGNSRLNIWVKMHGEFINSEDNTEEVRGMKNFMEKFALEAEKTVIGKEIEHEEKLLKNVEKELTKLIKKNEGLHKEIEKAKEAIFKAESSIEENTISQENKRTEIEEQKAALLKVREKLMAVGKN